MSSSSSREQKSSQRSQGQTHTETPAPSLAGHCPTPTQESSLSGIAGAVKDKAQEMASSLGSRTGDAWDSARHGAQQAASAVASTAGNAWDEVSRFVSRHPIAAVAAGGGVAFLLYRCMAETSGSDYSWSGGSYRSRGYEFPEQERSYGWGRDRGYDYPERQRGYDYPERQRGYDSGRSSYVQPQDQGQGTANTGGGFTERAQDFASTAAERAGQAWESTKQGAQQFASAVADRAGGAWETMGDWGRGYPLGTLLVGAALGFGLNELLRSQGVLGCATGNRQQGTYGADMSLRSGSSRL